MQDLRLVGVHDDGEHLVLTDSDGHRFRVGIDDRMRSLVRPQTPSTVTTAPARKMFDDVARPHRPESGGADQTMRPREIQAMLRTGSTIAEVAERSGWPIEKIERYAGPIQAERDHVAGMVRALTLRGRAGNADTTFDDRVTARLVDRGVDTEQVEWDAWKGDQGRWTVVCRFAAGGRGRQATWLFDPTDRTISATDDEARWLGEDEQAPGPVPAAPRPRRREAPVYDVEAEGGLDEEPVRVRTHSGGTTGPTQVGSATRLGDEDEETDGPVDLVSAMRERAGRRRRSRRHPRRPGTQDETAVAVPDDARPQQRIDVDSAEEPPLGSHPAPEEVTDAEAMIPEGEALDEPEAEQPDHDPITGTADLFADASLSEEAADEPKPAPKGRKGKKRGKKKASAPAGPPRVRDTADAPADAADDDPGSDGEEDMVTASRSDDPPASTHTDPPSRPSGARRGRPSVPSWDDIMFGTKGGPAR